MSHVDLHVQLVRLTSIVKVLCHSKSRLCSEAFVLKTKISHVTMVYYKESTTIIGITHGLAWEKNEITYNARKTVCMYIRPKHMYHIGPVKQFLYMEMNYVGLMSIISRVLPHE